MVMMVIDVLLTCGKLIQLECHCQLVNFFGLQLKKIFISCKKYFATIFITFNYVF
jgi:hypothetical protein